MAVRVLIKFLVIILFSISSAFLVYKTMRPQSPLLFENSDFENGTLKNWSAEGAAFESQPTLGDNPIKRGWNQLTNIQASYWIGTYERRPNTANPEGTIQDDFPTGRLTSLPFVIRKSKISFLVGAGNGTSETTLSLIVDNKPVLTHTPNATVTANEAMSPVTWDVSAWLKKKAVIAITDQGSGPWGHINADDFHYA